MSLAALIKAETTANTGHECKTCRVLERLTPQDRADFRQAVDVGVPGAVLARALTARLAELGADVTIGEQSVRRHIERGHGA